MMHKLNVMMCAYIDKSWYKNASYLLYNYNQFEFALVIS